MKEMFDSVLKFELFLPDSEFSVAYLEVTVAQKKLGVAFSGAIWPTFKTTGLKERAVLEKLITKSPSTFLLQPHKIPDY
jgi:hypothetical protein